MALTPYPAIAYKVAPSRFISRTLKLMLVVGQRTVMCVAPSRFISRTLKHQWGMIQPLPMTVAPSRFISRTLKQVNGARRLGANRLHHLGSYQEHWNCVINATVQAICVAPSRFISRTLKLDNPTEQPLSHVVLHHLGSYQEHWNTVFNRYDIMIGSCTISVHIKNTETTLPPHPHL